VVENPDTRTSILNAAEELFAEKGFDATSVREICTLAGVNIAAIHYHFGDKERLYIEAVKRAHSCGVHVDLSTLTAAQKPQEQLEQFIRLTACQMHEPKQAAAMKLVMRELTDPGKAAHIIVQEFIQPMAFMLRSILRELMPGVDERQILMIGFSIIGQLLYYRQNRPVSEMIFGQDHLNSISAEMVADHVVHFTFAALGLTQPFQTQTPSANGEA
jgi:AcrR family transcriptional regulator